MSSGGVPSAAPVHERARGPIRVLPEDVVRSIAAGEAVVDLAGAVKELLENALDADATSVNVSVCVRAAGMHISLHVSDDGRGIAAYDLPLLCQRHATSKIASLQDLRTAHTYGFRGEALASISQVARVKVVSMVREHTHALEAAYHDGELVAGFPKKVAGNPGTTIVVEDLFYNMPTRRRSMRPASEEYRAVLDVVGKYAIRHHRKSFTCKKTGAVTSGGAGGGASGGVLVDLRTTGCDDARSVVRTVYGSSIAQELTELSVVLPEVHISGSCLVSNANYNAKRFVFVCFINGRLVNCAPIKRALLAVYGDLLPKGTYPFAYLDVSMPPEDVDANIHPTKSEVQLLHLNALLQSLSQKVSDRLKSAQTSRTYLVQGVLTQPLPTGTRAEQTAQQKRQLSNPACPEGADDEEADFQPQKKASNLSLSQQRQQHVENVPAHLRVRTDSKNPLGSIEPYLSHDTGRLSMKTRHCRSYTNAATPEGLDADAEEENDAPERDGDRECQPGSNHDVISSSAAVKRARLRTSGAPPLLDSIHELLDESRADSSAELERLLREHVFVGAFVQDEQWFCVVQHQSRVVLLRVYSLLRALVYQIILHRFSNLDQMQLEPALSVEHLLRLRDGTADRDRDTEREKSASVADALRILNERAGLLSDYFSIEIRDGHLVSMPSVLPLHSPDPAWWPDLMHDLAFMIDYSVEKPCLHAIAETLANYYALPNGESLTTRASAPFREYERMLNYSALALMRQDFSVPRQLEQGSHFVILSTLDKLYKVFERC
ncbi:DNA mismatch repair protein Mlh1 [Porphyridium purpureum]|uniref:DNA mismatch repair protein Mlh1 n=1 Tax=Porphyridium purpureum TaxID=35688 RepID=A0A5J4YZW4_PORPP|nr:DNA mismatch repair protein Mlh1 [Porphyridium purpureum]|eukprot:POR4271..scf208_2